MNFPSHSDIVETQQGRLARSSEWAVFLFTDRVSISQTRKPSGEEGFCVLRIGVGQFMTGHLDGH